MPAPAFSAALPCSYHRKVISHSDGHSVVGCRRKQKEPITQSIRNRREHSSRFKVMFYVIGSEKSKSSSALYNSRRQNQRHGGAVRHFRCTDTVSDKSDFHKMCLNILIQFLCVDKLPRHHYTNSDTDCQYLHRRCLVS